MAIAGLEVGLPDNGESVTVEWLTEVLRTSGAIDGDTTVATVDCARWESGGLLSYLYRAELGYDGGDGPASLVLKFPTDLPNQRAMADAFGIYRKEVVWYRDIAPRSDVEIPLIHAAMITDDASNYCVVMEDLRHLRQADRYTGMSWDEAVRAVVALADYHSAWTGSDELPGLSELFHGLSSPLNRGGMPGLAAAGWPVAKVEAAHVLDESVVALGDRWSDLLPKMLDRMEERPTLCHLDWRSDNLFIDDDGDRIVAIDPQIAGVGNPACDLGYFISQSLEREVREGRERELVQLYVDRMAERGHTIDGDQLFDDVRISAAVCLIYGIVSYPEWDNLDDVAKHATETLLRRAAATAADLDSLAAVTAL
ncbi:MAG: phosphotransferase [Actinomycetota bacterium]